MQLVATSPCRQCNRLRNVQQKTSEDNMPGSPAGKAECSAEKHAEKRSQWSTQCDFSYRTTHEYGGLADARAEVALRARCERALRFERAGRCEELLQRTACKHATCKHARMQWTTCNGHQKTDSGRQKKENGQLATDNMLTWTTCQHRRHRECQFCSSNESNTANVHD
jgi:hypothetical protein